MAELTDAEIEAIRKAAVKATVDKMSAEGCVIAHRTVAARLERDFPGFEYIAKVDNFRAVIDDSFPPLPVVGALAAVESADTVTPNCDELGAPIEPEPEPMAVEELRTAIHEAEMNRGEIRSELYTARASRVIARTILAQCIQTFISGRPVMTPTELAKSFCAGAAADRQTMKDQGADHVPPAALRARSVLDRSLAYGSGGDSNDYARKRFVHGHRRGAVSQATASRINQERALQAAAKASGQ